MSVTRIHPDEQDADLIRLPAPGRPAQRVHPTAARFREDGMRWYMRIRVLQIADGHTFEEAVEQANAEFGWPGKRIK